MSDEATTTTTNDAGHTLNGVADTLDRFLKVGADLESRVAAEAENAMVRKIEWALHTFREAAAACYGTAKMWSINEHRALDIKPTSIDYERFMLANLRDGARITAASRREDRLLAFCMWRDAAFAASRYRHGPSVLTGSQDVLAFLDGTAPADAAEMLDAARDDHDDTIERGDDETGGAE